MKKVLSLLSVVVFFALFLTSCSSKKEEKPRTSTDQYMDQQMDEIADQKAAIKNEYRLRMERKKLQDMWERYSDCDAVPEPQKKTEQADCPSQGPQQIVIIDNSNCGNSSGTTRKSGSGRGKKTPKKTEQADCPTCPDLKPAPKAGPNIVDTPCVYKYVVTGKSGKVYFQSNSLIDFENWKKNNPSIAKALSQPTFTPNTQDSF